MHLACKRYAWPTQEFLRSSLGICCQYLNHLPNSPRLSLLPHETAWLLVYVSSGGHFVCAPPFAPRPVPTGIALWLLALAWVKGQRGER